MTIDSETADLDREEMLEVLPLLPPIEGKAILELGAGIGCFTGELATKAGRVLVVDFIANMKKKDENINSHPKNVKFMCADVTSSDLDSLEGSFDLIFSNRLLMYLSDKEVENLPGQMVKWLKDGGFIFLIESCFHQSRDSTYHPEVENLAEGIVKWLRGYGFTFSSGSCVHESGDSKRKNDPTHYREPRYYTKVFKECLLHDGSGNPFELSLVYCKCVGPYVCWKWKKVRSEDDRMLQHFLDDIHYECKRILQYQRVFGQGFASTGGIERTKEFVGKLELKAGQKVLDVGCGIGGCDFYMAEKFGVHVVGIDLSINMISFALERASGLSSSVEFEIADITKKTYPDNTFDVIYSRDTILHIRDKPALFKMFYKWLKPGGKVLISDYCEGAKTPSSEFAKYIKHSGFDLHSMETYGQMLKDVGFGKVITEDRTYQFSTVLRRERDALGKEKEAFIKDFSEEDYYYIMADWNAKLDRNYDEEQRWGLFIAEKK